MYPKSIMQTVSATELARSTSQILDRVATHGATVAVERNRTVIAEITPPTRTMTAAQALAGLGAPLTPEQAARWLRDSRAEFDQAVRDPWA
jgi:antitoxin (DNA-binding transcriptional repressor) of toxin-antitoxin stability system